MTQSSTNTIDPRREQELRIQALGAAISRRDWHATERAYEAIRDHFDRSLNVAATVPASADTVDGLRMLGAAISRNDWHAATLAYEVIQDQIERLRAAAATVPASADIAIAALAERLWRVHPREVQDLGLTRQQFIEREVRAVFASLLPDVAATATEPVAYVPLSQAPDSLGEPLWREVFAAKWLRKGAWDGFKLMPLYGGVAQALPETILDEPTRAPEQDK